MVSEKERKMIREEKEAGRNTREIEIKRDREGQRGVRERERGR